MQVLVGLHLKWRDVTPFGYILDGSIRFLQLSARWAYNGAVLEVKKEIADYYGNGGRLPSGLLSDTSMKNSEAQAAITKVGFRRT